MDKHHQTEQAQQEFARLMQAIAGMDEAALTAPGIGDWSVREVLAHIAGWAQIDTEILRRIARGERPLPEGEDYGTGESRNPGYAAAAAAKSGGGVIAEARLAFDAFIAAAQAVPDERFADGRTAQRVMQDSGLAHIREHRAEIESYRASRA